MHAAEVLAAHGDPGAARAAFLAELATHGGVPRDRIGIHRVLARTAGTAAARRAEVAWLAGVLADPQVAVFDSKGAVIAQNNDWSGGATLSAAFAQVGAFALGASTKDAAVVVTLAPGLYTAQVSGVSSTTGVGLVEIYELP